MEKTLAYGVMIAALGRETTDQTFASKYFVIYVKIRTPLFWTCNNFSQQPRGLSNHLLLSKWMPALLKRF